MDSTLSWGFKLNRVRVVPICLYRLNKSKEKKIKGTKKKIKFILVNPQQSYGIHLVKLFFYMIKNMNIYS
jgi:hypothetical protein